MSTRITGVPSVGVDIRGWVDPHYPDITWSGEAKVEALTPVPNPSNPRDLGMLLTWLVEYRDRGAEAEVDLPTDKGFQRYRAHAKANGNIVLKPIEGWWSV